MYIWRVHPSVQATVVGSLERIVGQNLSVTKPHFFKFYNKQTTQSQCITPSNWYNTNIKQQYCSRLNQHVAKLNCIFDQQDGGFIRVFSDIPVTRGAWRGPVAPPAAPFIMMGAITRAHTMEAIIFHGYGPFIYLLPHHRDLRRQARRVTKSNIAH